VRKASEKTAAEQPRRRRSTSSFKSLGSIISEKPVKKQTQQDAYFTKEKMKTLLPAREKPKKKKEKRDKKEKKDKKITVTSVP